MNTDEGTWLAYLGAMLIALFAHQWYLRGFQRWRDNRQSIELALAKYVSSVVCPTFERLVYDELNQGISQEDYARGADPGRAQRERIAESVAQAVKTAQKDYRRFFGVTRLVGSLRVWECAGKAVCLPTFLALFLCLVLFALMPSWRQAICYVALCLMTVSVAVAVACHLVADRRLHRVEALLEEMEQ